MKLLKVIFFLSLYLVSTFSKAQLADYDVRVFTTEDGISNNVIYGVIQDQKGFIWFGSEFGLNRFDGEAFKVFSKRENGLEAERVSSILIDKNEKLWLKSDFNSSSIVLSIFDANLEQAISFDQNFPNAPFQLKDVLHLATGENHDIWIILKEGKLYKYNGVFQLISENKIFAETIVFCVLEENEPWILIEDQLVQFNNKGQLLDKVQLGIGTDAPSGAVKRFGKLSEERVWISFYDKDKGDILQIIETGEDAVVFEEINNQGSNPVPSAATHLKENSKGSRLWIGGVNLLKSMNEQGEARINFEEEIKKYFPGFAIHTIYLDKFQNVWISTNRGLVLISPKRNLFHSILQAGADELKNSMRGIIDYDEEQLLAAGYTGFFLIDKNSGDTSILKNYVGDIIKQGLDMLKVGDTILIGEHSSVFHFFDKKNKQSSSQDYGYEPRTNTIFFHQDWKKQIWVGTTDGLFLLNLKSLEVTRPPQADLNSDLYLSSISHLDEDENGLWVSSSKGLFLVDAQGVILQDFPELSSFIINHFYFQNGETCWLATKGNGLVKWNRKTGNTRQFTTEDGLSHDLIYSINEDAFGQFWLPSNNGLMRFNPQDFSVSTFYERHGIAHFEFNSRSRFQAEDGKIYLGGVNGITIIDPKDFQKVGKNNFPLTITSVKRRAKGEVQFSETLPQFRTQNAIDFVSDDKEVILKFSLLDFKNSFYSNYSYKIIGYDDDWNLLKNNELRINQIPFGNYKIQIRGKGFEDDWSNEMLTIPLRVLKPFYLKWQFISLCLLALVGLIYSIFRLRIIQLKKRNLALENIVAERTQELAKANEVKDQFFAIIAHDMRGLVLSFKNISKKVSFLQRKGRQDEVDDFLKGIDQSSESLSNLLDNLLNWALVEKGVFPHHPEYFNLQVLVRENLELFYQLSKIKEVHLQADIPQDLELFADKNAVSAIIRNVINNSIKFSESGDEVSVQAMESDRQIEIKIKDTGVGIDSDKLKNIFELDAKKSKDGTIGEQGTGLGLLLCKELAILNQGKISVKSKLGKGTQVKIIFPKAS